jgi:hypothetical protein
MALNDNILDGKKADLKLKTDNKKLDAKNKFDKKKAKFDDKKKHKKKLRAGIVATVVYIALATAIVITCIVLIVVIGDIMDALTDTYMALMTTRNSILESIIKLQEEELEEFYIQYPELRI